MSQSLFYEYSINHRIIQASEYKHNEKYTINLFIHSDYTNALKKSENKIIYYNKGVIRRIEWHGRQKWKKKQWYRMNREK